jgi:hypothetical protein
MKSEYKLGVDEVLLVSCPSDIESMRTSVAMSRDTAGKVPAPPAPIDLKLTNDWDAPPLPNLDEPEPNRLLISFGNRLPNGRGSVSSVYANYRLATPNRRTM